MSRSQRALLGAALGALLIGPLGCDGDGGSAASGGGRDASVAPPAPLTQGRWEGFAAVPAAPPAYAGVAAAGGRVLLLGGEGATAGTTALSAYDPTTNTWQTLEPLPAAVQMPNVAGIDGRLYVLGGLAVAGAWEYDVAGKRWRARAAMPLPMGRGVAAVGVHEKKILLAGGIIPGLSDNGLNTGVRQKEALAYDTSADSWEALPDLPQVIGYAMGAVTGDTFWVIGGSGNAQRTDQVDAFDLRGRAWQRGTSPPALLSSAAAAVLGGRIYVTGGISTSTASVSGDTYAFDPVAQTWDKVAPLKTPRFAMGAATLSGRIYVPGGTTFSGTMPMASATLEAFVP